MTATGEFFEQRCTFPIHLHPSRLGHVRDGVEEQLNALLMTYVDELGGVLLSYSDLTLSSSPSTNPLQCGFIFQERSYIHFEVAVKALTWRVAVGARYEGVVNAVAGDHLAILLHGAFNATIPLSGALAPKNWQYDADKERWIDNDVFTGDVVAAEEEDEDAASVKEEADAPAKKLTKKELKKLERRRLRDVMLEATGRGASSKQARPAAGVITRGVHVRFECSTVQHSDEYFKLTGVVVSKRSVPGAELGLTGGFTPLAPVEGVKTEESPEEEGAEAAADANDDFDMSALAAVTAPSSAVKSTPAKSAQSPSLGSTPAPASAPKKAHTDKQQEKYLKKKAKLAERMAAKEEAAEDDEEDAPITAVVDASASKKKRKSVDEEDEKKKKKKMKIES